jgi:hypothetical protein
MEPLSIGLIASSVLTAIGLASLAALKGWNAWLEYKRLELASHIGDATLPPAGGRIELADLKERVSRRGSISKAGLLPKSCPAQGGLHPSPQAALSSPQSGKRRCLTQAQERGERRTRSHIRRA